MQNKMTQQKSADLAQACIDQLASKKLTVVTAESCTAGLIACTLSQAKGAGDHLHGGYVVYTKAQKHRSLGLDLAMLEREGAVNARVAALLATQALARSDADLAIAATGVAGPKPDEDGNEVGTLFLAVAKRGGECVVDHCRLTGLSPDAFLNTAVEKALTMLTKLAQS
jgi:nicotinamide-nucleotide amidase